MLALSNRLICFCKNTVTPKRFICLARKNITIFAEETEKKRKEKKISPYRFHSTTMGSIEHLSFPRHRCRMCHQFRVSMIDIFKGSGQRLYLIEKIRAYGLIVSPTDRLPKTLCQSCIQDLEENYYFCNTLKLLHRPMQRSKIR